jgi:hypothetical protein
MERNEFLHDYTDRQIPDVSSGVISKKDTVGRTPQADWYHL